MSAKCTANMAAVDGEEEAQDDSPEGGWGWVIAASNCCLLTLYFGLVFTLPIFLVEWMFVFNAKAIAVSWVVSLGNGVCGLFSPLAGLLYTRYGSRKVAMLGGFVFSSSVLVSIFSNTVWHLIITLGLSAGIGGALMFTPSLVMLGHYFDKRYVLANSIAFLGFGFAQMVMPRFVQYLNEEYGWRGALLILSAVLSHAIICAALLRPRRTRHMRKEPLPSWQFLKLRPEIKVDIGGSLASLHNYDMLREFPSSDSQRPKDTNLQQVISKREFQTLNECKEPTTSRGCIKTSRTFISDKIFYLKHTYGLALLAKNIYYHAILIGGFLGGLGWSITNGHLVARAILSGVAENNAAMLVTLIGVGSIVGRVSHGILIDKGFISRDVMFIGSFAVTSLASFLNPAMDNYIFLCVLAGLFGLAHGVANSLVFAMMRLQVGSIEAAAALSIGSLTQAISNTIGIVLAGMLYDVTDNYTVPFMLSGSAILTGGFLLFLVLIVYKRYETETKNGHHLEKRI